MGKFAWGNFSWGIFDWKDVIILFLIMYYPMFSPNMYYPMFSPNNILELIQVDFKVIRRCHRGEHRGEQNY
jgi:hypothetical protein